MSTQRRHWICKHSLGVCGTNSVLVKWKQREDDSCIRCGAIETPTHVWKCPDHDSQFIWTSALLDLDLWLEQQNTLPELRNLIIQSLKDWLLNQPPSISNGLALCQADIGWDYVIEGFLPTQWIDAQSNHYLSLNRLESGKRWATALILKFWNIAWDLWQHRNHTTHHSNALAATSSITQEINALLQKGPTTPDLAPLYSDHEQLRLLSATTAYKNAWIAAVRAHEGYRKRKERSALTSMQQVLRNYLSHS